MIIAKSYEEIAGYIEAEGKHVFYFTADWCGDCTYLKPALPAIEAEFRDFTFVQIDRDQFIDLCQKWHIMGIPSFVVTEKGQELGRLVNKLRKTKAEVTDFLATFLD